MNAFELPMDDDEIEEEEGEGEPAVCTVCGADLDWNGQCGDPTHNDDGQGPPAWKYIPPLGDQ